jgi:hypothetical protein
MPTDVGIQKIHGCIFQDQKAAMTADPALLSSKKTFYFLHKKQIDKSVKPL